MCRLRFLPPRAIVLHHQGPSHRQRAHEPAPPTSSSLWKDAVSNIADRIGNIQSSAASPSPTASSPLSNSLAEFGVNPSTASSLAQDLRQRRPIPHAAPPSQLPTPVAHPGGDANQQLMPPGTLRSSTSAPATAPPEQGTPTFREAPAPVAAPVYGSGDVIETASGSGLISSPPTAAAVVVRHSTPSASGLTTVFSQGNTGCGVFSTASVVPAARRSA